MSNIKATLICTLKNERLNLKEFIDSLFDQTRVPDEIIIVDGGSTDGTIGIINDYIKNKKPLRLIIKEGANISQGRNIAIKNAKYDIIVSTDAGCKLDSNWFKNIIRPFKESKDIDVVSGWYEPDARSRLEYCIADLYFPKLNIITRNTDSFLPSSRSVAFKKSCWEKVGGYPEWLYTAEDTLFDLNLKKAGSKFYFAKDAVVYWRVRNTFKAFLKQQYFYAKGNGEAKIYPPKILLYGITISVTLYILSLYYSIFLMLLLSLWCLYISVRLRRVEINKLKYIPIYVSLIVGADVSNVCGYIRGRFF